MHRTKIVCTIGTHTVRKGVGQALDALVRAGMDVIRMNMSYAGGAYTMESQIVDWAQDIGYRLENRTIAVMADLQGIKFRVRGLPGGEIPVPEGGEIWLRSDSNFAQEAETIPIPNSLFPLIGPYVAEHGHMKIYFGDGDIIVNACEVMDDGCLRAKVVIGGTLKNGKGVTLQGVDIQVPEMLTEKDKGDLRWIAKNGGITFIALSFVQSAQDIRELRRFMVQECGVDAENVPPVIAKIETRRAVDNIDEILDEAYGIMLARGDMGLQIGVEKVTEVQKTVIRKCQIRGKPVITATQMLTSMETKLEPQRAEVSDIFNAILDGTDAIMLSGETSAGNYPVEAVQMMAKVAIEAENYRIKQDQAFPEEFLERLNSMQIESHQTRLGRGKATADLISHAAVVFTASDALQIKAILTPTTSGKTTRLISRFRPHCMIIAAAHKLDTARQLALSYGVIPLYIRQGPTETLEHIFGISIRRAVKRNLLGVGDVVVFSGGYPMWQAGTTNLLKIHVVEKEEVERDGHTKLF